MNLVSIVIPTYKRGDKLENAIKSACSQTYKNIEIIVIDDNFNDLEERKTTRQIVQKYKNVKLIENKKNLGGALSRNAGIIAATGQYIAFLDDDDIFHKEKIEKQMKLIKEKESKGIKVGMVYCYKNRFDDNGMYEKCKKVDIEGNCLFEHMNNIMETTSTWLCPKNVLLDVGLFEHVKAHQDSILLMKILANGYQIFRVPEYLLDFYIHYGNGITKHNRNYIDYTKTLFEYKKKYYNLLTPEQIEQIEYKNSSMIIRLYRKNNMKSEYIKEMKKVFKNNKFRLHTLKMILFYFFFRKRKIENEK